MKLIFVNTMAEKINSFLRKSKQCPFNKISTKKLIMADSNISPLVGYFTFIFWGGASYVFRHVPT
jgi:hypothetical protein